MRKAAVGLIILLFVLAGGWTAAWFYVASEAGHQLDAWLKTEASHGRTWTCPGRTVGGFPFAISINCATPSFAGRALNQAVQIQVAGLAAQATIFNPHGLSVSLRSPLTYKTSDGQANLTATWSHLNFQLAGLPTPDTLALDGADLVVDGAFGETGRQGGKAAQLDASFAIDRQTPEPTLQFAVAVKGTPIPDLDAILGGAAPVDVALTGRIDKVDVASGRTPAEVIENWRQSGGSIALADSRIVRGDSSVTGSGSLALDDAHRPQGRIDASFVGLDQVLRRYGINGDLAAAGSLLGKLFGGGRKPQPQADPNALNLPITFQNGRLGIGPIRTQIAIPPVY